MPPYPYSVNGTLAPVPPSDHQAIERSRKASYSRGRTPVPQGQQHLPPRSKSVATTPSNHLLPAPVASVGHQIVERIRKLSFNQTRARTSTPQAQKQQVPGLSQPIIPASSIYWQPPASEFAGHQSVERSRNVSPSRNRTPVPPAYRQQQLEVPSQFRPMVSASSEYYPAPVAPVIPVDHINRKNVFISQARAPTAMVNMIPQQFVRPPVKPESPSPACKELAKLCARYTRILFQPPAARDGEMKLNDFIVNVLQRSRFPESVAFAALMYLQRVKMKCSSWKAQTGYGLFLSAYMIAAKFLHDREYATQSWAYIGSHMFKSVEVRKFEKDLLEQMEWDVVVNGEKLEEFTELIKEQYSRSGPRPGYAIIDTHACLKDSVGDRLRAQGKDPTSSSPSPASYTIGPNPTPPPFVLVKEPEISWSYTSHRRVREERSAHQNRYVVSGPSPW